MGAKERPSRLQPECFFLESDTDFNWFGRSSGLLVSTPPSHAPMAVHSGLTYWASACELTAAGLRRTLTGFPLGTLDGRPNRLQKYKIKPIWQNIFYI